MEIIQKLNTQVEKILSDYELLRLENNSLKIELERLKNRNDELIRNNQDMLLKIDSTLNLSRMKKGE